MRYILLPMLLFVLAAIGIAGYSMSRQRDVASVTGDYAAAATQAESHDVRLLLVVDQSPPFL